MEEEPVEFNPNEEFEQDINNSLVLQNKLIEPETTNANSFNRNHQLANWDEKELAESRIRDNYGLHIMFIIERFPRYNVENSLIRYLSEHVYHRNDFLSGSSVSKNALARKLFRTTITDHNIKQNEIKAPQISPIFPSKSRYNDNQ